jgi:hypothetical protein
MHFLTILPAITTLALSTLTAGQTIRYLPAWSDLLITPFTEPGRGHLRRSVLGFHRLSQRMDTGGGHGPHRARACRRCHDLPAVLRVPGRCGRGRVVCFACALHCAASGFHRTGVDANTRLGFAFLSLAGGVAWRLNIGRPAY